MSSSFPCPHPSGLSTSLRSPWSQRWVNGPQCIYQENVSANASRGFWSCDRNLFGGHQNLQYVKILGWVTGFKYPLKENMISTIIVKVSVSCQGISLSTSSHKRFYVHFISPFFPESRTWSTGAGVRPSSVRPYSSSATFLSDTAPSANSSSWTRSSSCSTTTLLVFTPGLNPPTCQGYLTIHSFMPCLVLFCAFMQEWRS